jgi:hypothetical protein
MTQNTNVTSGTLLKAVRTCRLSVIFLEHPHRCFPFWPGAAIDIEPEMQMNTRDSGRFPGCALLPFGGDTMDISLLRT